MSSAELFALIALATVGTFTPGPNTALSATLAANHGLRRALPFVCAVPAGWGVLLVLNAAGLGALVLGFPPLRWGLLAAGVLYLLWLAWKLASTQRLSDAAQGPIVGFKQGVMLQFINIKAWFLAMSVVSGWVIGHDDTPARLLETLPIFMFFGLASNFTYAWIGASLRHWLRGPNDTAQRLQWFNRLMALALLGTVAWMVRSALQTL
ncbi:lysine transporter LysE [Limnohabitans sp. Rim8]|jgi:threonine/homoserine/homoserine lactone efflux protein|uniref:LysE family translocator n=1 Tax=Limnohabitans sp. Rim8 TaxID=1100718 RepID=UPI000D3AF356|nr:LysE family translocator [Limnohabitans sp. Rim8]PUE62347.1 lysine transporter LysE [Limnohabitans sp. Rim8]